MNTRSNSTGSRFSFFHREPKFSVLIVAASLLVLAAFLFFVGLDDENTFSSTLCYQSIGKMAKVNLHKIKDLFEQITSGLALMPR